MKIKLDLKKGIEENASVYFDKAKKFKKKITGCESTIKLYEKKLSKLDKDFKKTEVVVKVDRKKHWFEKFRWFYTSTGKLVVGGRDATTNEIVIKKHVDKNIQCPI